MKISIVQDVYIPFPEQGLPGGVNNPWLELGAEFSKAGHEVLHISRHEQGLAQKEWMSDVLHIRIKTRNQSCTPPGSRSSTLFLLHAKTIAPIDSDIMIVDTGWSTTVTPGHPRRKYLTYPGNESRMSLSLDNFRRRESFSNISPRADHPGDPATHSSENCCVVRNSFKGMQDRSFLPKQKLIQYTGKIHPGQRVHQLVSAFREWDKDWQLQLIGPTGEGDGSEYTRYLQSLVGDANITFHDPFKGTVCCSASNAAIVVYASSSPSFDTFCLAPLEAMRHGCIPVVPCDTNFSHYINHGRNGFFFDHQKESGDFALTTILHRLVQDKGTRDSIATEAGNIQQTFPIARVASHLLDEFMNLIGD